MDLDANQKEILKVLGSRSKAQNLFSVKELAQFLEVSVRSIRRMHAAGVDPALHQTKQSVHVALVLGVLTWLPMHFLATHADKT